MKTVGETLRLAAEFLEKRSVDRSRRIAEEFLAHALGIKRIDLYLQYDRPVEEKELIILREGLKRKVRGEPLEYIVGEVEFFHCRIRVNRSVLIPRPETEILVDQFVKRFKNLNLTGKILWDICTGSGCIGIALKKAFPALRVVLSDLSPEALAVATENARLNEVDVELRQGDLLAPFHGERTHFVVCNPPYVTEQEYLTIDPSEPKLALVGGKKGTEFYEKLNLTLPSYLHSGAQVFFELGATQGPALTKLFIPPIWVRSELLKDWSGKDRFFFLEIQ